MTFFAGVPDSLLKEFCACVAAESLPSRHVIAANEGAAVALATGVHLATGDLPVVYLQNSGFGNLLNPLLSLADAAVYGIPMILMIGWRGESGSHDEPQHMVQGRIQEDLHGAIGLPCMELGPAVVDSGEIVEWVSRCARDRGGPAALLVRKGTFHPFMRSTDEPTPMMTREAAIEIILDSLDERDVVVSTTGMASREVFECRERRGEGHERDFLTVGSMGHASQIALGLAMGAEDRTVWCLDGDGSVIMHMGSLAINGTSGQSNFRHVVLNNAAHDSVGGQPTVADRVDLCGIARSCGYASVFRATSEDGLRAALANPLPGPSFLEVRVRKGARPELGRPTSSPQKNKHALEGFLRG